MPLMPVVNKVVSRNVFLIHFQKFAKQLFFRTPVNNKRGKIAENEK